MQLTCHVCHKSFEHAHSLTKCCGPECRLILRRATKSRINQQARRKTAPPKASACGRAKDLGPPSWLKPVDWTGFPIHWSDT